MCEVINLDHGCEVRFIRQPVVRLAGRQRLVLPWVIPIAERSILDFNVVRIWLSDQDVGAVVGHISKASEGCIVALMEKRGAVHDIQCHGYQSHVDAECDPTPEGRRGARESREQRPQHLWLPLLILDCLLYIQLLERAIFGAVQQLNCFGSRAIAPGNRLLYDNVEFIRQDLVLGCVLEFYEERGYVDGEESNGERRYALSASLDGCTRRTNRDLQWLGSAVLSVNSNITLTRRALTHRKKTQMLTRSARELRTVRIPLAEAIVTMSHGRRACRAGVYDTAELEYSKYVIAVTRRG